MLRGLLPEMLPSMLVLIPVFLLLDRLWFRNWRKGIFFYLFACYLTAMGVLVGMPNILYHRFSPNLCLTPDLSILLDWHNGFLNVLLYVPLGMFLCLLWKSYRQWYRTVCFGCSLSLFTELMQLFTFRATDVNDLLTNTLGAFLGYLLAKPVLHFFPGRKALGSHREHREIPVILSVSFATIFFLQPFLLKIVYYSV